MKQQKLVINLIVVVLGLFVMGAMLSPVVLAQDPDYDVVNRIAQKMNCPTCTGVNLADCRTQTCAQWRDQIKDLLAKGYSEQEVLDYFVTQYGPQVLQEPPKSGFTLWLWVLPIAMIILGAIILFYTVRRWTAAKTAPAVAAATPAQPASSSAAGDDYLNQVEKDLQLD